MKLQKGRRGERERRGRITARVYCLAGTASARHRGAPEYKFLFALPARTSSGVGLHTLAKISHGSGEWKGGEGI